MRLLTIFIQDVAVIQLARRWDRVLLLQPDLELLEPDVSTLLPIVRQSRSGRFSNEPVGFLKDLGKEKYR
jgi:hypothetical protein